MKRFISQAGRICINMDLPYQVCVAFLSGREKEKENIHCMKRKIYELYRNTCICAVLKLRGYSICLHRCESEHICQIYKTRGSGRELGCKSRRKRDLSC